MRPGMLREFVELAERCEEPFTGLCARFGISRKTGYKWLKRFRADGHAGLQHQSRRPKNSPRKTPGTVVDAVLAARRAQPDWSTARIHALLQEQGIARLPAPSTIDLILRRQREAAAMQQQWLGPEMRRFEPNYRWTCRLGAEVRLGDGTPVVPVVVRDETTDFFVGATVLATRREQALEVFAMELLRRHGLPWRMLLARDPGLCGQAPCCAHSSLSICLMRLGVMVEFSFEPPTTGLASANEARRQLAARLATLPAYQRAPLAERALPPDPLVQFAQAAVRLTIESAPAELERLRELHNFSGQHEAMQRRSPISLYRPSARLVPPETPVPAYPPEAVVRLVSEKGIFTFQRRLVHVGRPFAGLCVELKDTPYPERFVVLFAGQMLGVADLAQAEIDHTTSLQLRSL